MTSISLGRFLLDGHHVTACRHAPDEALLGARLERHGLQVKLYAGKAEGRVIDLARQFLRMRTDAYLLAVNPYTLALAGQVAKQLAALKPEARFFLKGDVSPALRAAVLPADMPDVCWLPDDLDRSSAAIAQALGAFAVDTPTRSERPAIPVEAPQPATSGSYGTHGVIALRTGMYFEPHRAPGIRHLEVSSSIDVARRSTAYAWAAPHMESRSAVVYTQADGATPPLDAFRTPLTAETGGWPMHSYVFGTASTGLTTVHFDGQAEAQAMHRGVPLSQLSADSPGHAASTIFITMSTAADVDEFERRLALLATEGRMHIEAPHRQKLFDNSCRWTARGTCQLPLLKRVQVDPDLGLGACRDAGRVGAVGEAYDDIIVRIKRDQQAQSIQRECAVCPVRDDCSQCTQLPAAWGGRYCSIRKTHGCTSLFVELFSMSFGLAQLFGVPDDGTALAMTISHAGLPNHFYGGAVREQRSGPRPVLLSAHGKTIAWWRGTKKLCRLSGAMALMAEAWWSAGTDEDIVGELSSRFNVSSDVARAGLDTGVQKLREEGVIHA